MSRAAISPAIVHDTLSRHMLADGYDIVLDLEKSQGRRLWDARRGRAYLDLFSFFATLPVGVNHPRLHEEAFQRKLLRAALVNPSNSDIYTVEMAEFLETFSRVAMPAYLPHAFFVSGGALGVENALKAAMDWKVRQNFRKGLREEKGHQILHFRSAFHGRSGYTLSMTNTADPRKYQYFARFDWPRVDVPALEFPLDGTRLERVERLERDALGQAQQAFRDRPGDIAAIIIEPIQAEGGDNHVRGEFLRNLRALADEHDALLIFDEVQTGVGLTGRFWAHAHFDVEPDLLAFGKKMQVCGMLAGPKLDREPDNVFVVSSRLNSTWGGSLVDMVRAERYLEIIEEEQLVAHAAEAGRHLLGRLEALQAEYPGLLGNARGRGLMCAIDFRNAALRDAVADKAYEMGVIILRCGTKSVRFRPPLDITADELDEGVDLIGRAVGALAAIAATPGKANA